MAMKQEVNTSLILTTGLMSVLLLVVIVIGVQAWFLNEEHAEVEAKWESSPNVALADLWAGQQAKINQTRWVSKEQGRAAIPIADAMRVVAAAGGKLPVTQPATPPATQSAGPATQPTTAPAEAAK